MRGLFVTGTDTGVGKTIVAAAICSALAVRGERVAAFKPAVTGTDEPPGSVWPPDHELLAAVASTGQTPEEVAPYRFGPAVSPHYAAELAGAHVDPARIVEDARSAGAGADALICEGVGGLLVPLCRGYDVRDLIAELELPAIVAARTGLGTINHTLLTVEAARAAGLSVAGIVMTPWRDPAPIEESNRATVERLTGIAVSTLAPVTRHSEWRAEGSVLEGSLVSTLAPVTRDSFAGAGGSLPLDEWLAL